jgi:hypothetical protein
MSHFGASPPPALDFAQHKRVFRECADVAQLVAHHLAKVDVAGSSPVVRSHGRCTRFIAGFSNGGVAERRGSGLQILLHGFKSRLHLHFLTIDIQRQEKTWS